MHETVVAQSLLTSISEQAKKHSAKPVAAKISCGMLNAINKEVLCFAFEAIAKGTVCEGMKLQVEHKPMTGRCSNCEGIFEFELSRPFCPKCDSKDFELLLDAPLVLEQIEFETE